MPTTPTLLVPGASVQAGTAQALIDDARAWVNDVAAGDVVPDSVLTQHLVRPVISGFPAYGMEGILQSARGYSFGLNQPAALSPAEWGARQERLTIPPRACHPTTGYFFLPFGAPLDPLFSSDFHFLLTGEAQVRANNFGGAPTSYPDGAGGPAGTIATRAGYLVLGLYSRSSGTFTEFVESRHILYPMQEFVTGYPERGDQFVMYGVGSYVASIGGPPLDFELILAYNRDILDDNDFPMQIDLSRLQLSIEVF